MSKFDDFMHLIGEGFDDPSISMPPEYYHDDFRLRAKSLLNKPVQSHVRPRSDEEEVLMLLSNAQSMMGPMTDEYKQKIVSYVKKPSRKKWDDIRGIIIGGSRTIWQAVLKVDPTFPRSGPARKSEPWKRIPDAKLIIAALRYNAGRKPNEWQYQQ